MMLRPYRAADVAIDPRTNRRAFDKVSILILRINQGSKLILPLRGSIPLSRECHHSSQN